MDVVNVWQVIVITIGSAFLLGMIYMAFIRCFAGVLIWISILGIMAILGGGGYWVWRYKDHYDPADNNYKYL
jgi:predicted lipid-binding transport protein (Tim44 family)